MSEDERAADRLPGDAVVIRSGEMKLGDFLKTLERHYVKYAEYALSVFCVPGLDAYQTAYAVGTSALPHGKFMETTVETIAAAGYDIKPSPTWRKEPEGHCDLFCEPSEEEWLRVRSLFGEPMINPVRRR